MSENYDPAIVVNNILRNRGETVCTAESCSGGIASGMLTEPSGASDVFVGGLVTYTNKLKTDLINVPEAMIEINGAVSAPVAIAMAKGAMAQTGADHALSITGIAGPEGGSDDKPVGTVWVCRASSDGSHDCRRFQFPGDRAWIRKASATMVICLLIMYFEGQAQTALPNEQERV